MEDLTKAVLTDQGLGNRENGPVEVVEAVGGVSRELQVLSLVLSNGNMRGPDAR